jgi:ornithine decarboxylase
MDLHALPFVVNPPSPQAGERDDSVWSNHEHGAVARARDTASLIAREAPQEPLFLFSRCQLIADARRFLAGFPGETAFAVKANPTPAVIGALHAAGIEAFDVASLAEMELVRRVAPQARLRFNNPVKTRGEIARAIRHFGVRHLTVDDELELDKVLAAAGALRLEIAVRFRTERKAGHHDFRTKFGATPELAACLLQAVAAAGHVPVLYFHPGSQCLAPDAYSDLIEDAGEIALAAAIVPAALNVGGGFPVSYPGDDAAPMEAFFEAIRAAHAHHFDPSATRLLCEPGRALAAPCMSLLVQVRHRRPTGEVFLSDGLYGALAELFIAPIRFPYRVLGGDGEPLGGPTEPTRVFGPTCDPTDVLPELLELPAGIAEGDYVEFGLIGGYGPSTVSRFNGFGTSRVVEVERVFAGEEALPTAQAA